MLSSAFADAESSAPSSGSRNSHEANARHTPGVRMVAKCSSRGAHASATIQLPQVEGRIEVLHISGTVLLNVMSCLPGERFFYRAFAYVVGRRHGLSR